MLRGERRPEVRDEENNRSKGKDNQRAKTHGQILLPEAGELKEERQRCCELDKARYCRTTLRVAESE
jgi:hypothetical protein